MAWEVWEERQRQVLVKKTVFLPVHRARGVVEVWFVRVMCEVVAREGLR